MPNGRGGRQGGGGRGMGGQGRGQGRGRGGRGGAGPGGFCICPNCGNRVPHQPGVPCMQVKCPNCGTQMVRE